MKRRDASALLSAVVLLTVVVLLATATWTALADTRADYLQLRAVEQKTLTKRYREWQKAQSSAASSTSAAVSSRASTAAVETHQADE